ncbi:hypothetical protein IWX90DRAFT_172523 [Phyllosticta citrichinensis]|uniref:Uncharacterized protein n=1 Tax=Phyllosticta citrichinensis TaxID=1130410 RepID=A0ABR1XV98_9PEZI
MIRPFIDYKYSLDPVIADYGDGEVEDFEEVDDGSDIMAFVGAKSLRGQKCKPPTSSSIGGPFDSAIWQHSRDFCNSLHVCWDYAAERHCKHGDYGKHHDRLVHFKITCPELLKFANRQSQQPCNNITTCIYGHDHQETRICRERISKDRELERKIFMR